MNNDPFKEYFRESEPDKRDKGYAWHTAIGLQAVDGLKTSDYLVHTAVRNIEGEISFEEANALLQTYYEENLRFCQRGRSALHRTSIFPFTESCSPASILTRVASGITTSQRRNGC